MSANDPKRTFGKLKLGGHGDIERATLERVLYIELLIVLPYKRQGIPRITERIGDYWADAINAGFEGAELGSGAAIEKIHAASKAPGPATPGTEGTLAHWRTH